MSIKLDIVDISCQQYNASTKTDERIMLALTVVHCENQQNEKKNKLCARS